MDYIISVRELLGSKPKRGGGPSRERQRRGRNATAASNLEDRRLVSVQFMVINRLK
jgi:hypothetical protein